MSKRKKRQSTIRREAAAIARETGLTIEEILQECARREAVEAASADPLPGPLALAFPAKSIPVGTLNIRPIVHADWATMRLIDSPLLKQIAELSKPAPERRPTPFTDQEEYEMILLLLLGAERAQVEASRDRQAFGVFARERIGHGLNPFVVEMLKKAVVTQFEISIATAVKFQGAAAAQSDNETFTKPPTGAKTASAGGSSISSVS